MPRSLIRQRVKNPSYAVLRNNQEAKEKCIAEVMPAVREIISEVKNRRDAALKYTEKIGARG